MGPIQTIKVVPTGATSGCHTHSKASRPKFDLIMQLLRDGDTLKVTRLDRLGRSLLDLITLGAELRQRGVGLHVIEQGIDTATAEGRAMFGTVVTPRLTCS